MTKRTFITKVSGNGVPVACNITSITLASQDGGDGVLKVSGYNQTEAEASVVVVSGTFNTAQVFFDGLPFMSGFTVHTDAGCQMAVIEYVPIE